MHPTQPNSNQLAPPPRMDSPTRYPAATNRSHNEKRNSRVAGVILAAGASSRMGTPKPLLKCGTRSFLETIVENNQRAAIPFIIILGHFGKEIKDRLGLPKRWLLWNERPELGPLSSLLLGLEHFRNRKALIVQAVDHPLISAGTLLRLSEAHLKRPDCILLPSFQGRKGHPTLFPKRFYRKLETAPLSEGARWVVRRNRASVLWVAVNDSGIHANFNRAGDLKKWNWGPSHLRWGPTQQTGPGPGAG